MNIQAKFQLQGHKTVSHGGEHVYHEFTFAPHYDPTIREDQRFATATPTGELKLMVNNPPVIEYWTSKLGQYFYLDLTPVLAESKT